MAECSPETLDALISAMNTCAPPSAAFPASSHLLSPGEASYEQFPFDKAILLNTHHIVFHSRPQPQDHRHVAFSTSTTICFNVLPGSKRHLQENEFLWHAVNNRCLAVPKHLQSLVHPLREVPEATLFALAIPIKLASFLQQVSLADMRAAIIDMLVDAYRGETAIGMLQMRNELDPTVWDDIMAALNGHIRVSEHAKAAGALLDFVMQCSIPEDGWTVDVTMGVFAPPVLPFLGGVVLQSIHDDWMLFLKYIRNVRVAWCTMQKLTRQGRQAQVWRRVRAVVLCALTERSYLSLLPSQIIESAIIPWLLFREACGGARETIESLTTRQGHTFEYESNVSD